MHDVSSIFPVDGTAADAIDAMRRSRAEGDDRRARAVIDEAMRRFPDDQDLAYESAVLLATEAGYAAAVAALRALTDGTTTATKVYRSLGRFARKAGLYDVAEHATLTAHLLRPKDGGILVELARTFEDQGKIDLSRVTLRGLAEKADVPPAVAAAYSRLHRTVETAPDMLRILERALAREGGVKPDDAQAILYETTVQQSILGNADEATACALRGIREFGDHKPMVEAMLRLSAAGQSERAGAMVTENMAEINARTTAGVHLQRRIGQLRKADRIGQDLAEAMAAGKSLVPVVALKDDRISLVDIKRLGTIPDSRRPIRFKDMQFSSRDVNNGFDRLGGMLDSEYERLVVKGGYGVPIFDRYDWSIYQMSDAYQAQPNSGHSALVSRNGYFLAQAVETYHPLIVREQTEAYDGDEWIDEAVSLPRISPRNYYHLLVSDLAPLHLYQEYFPGRMLYLSGEVRRDVAGLFLEALGVGDDQVVFAGGERNPIVKRCYMPFKTVGMVDESTFRLTSFIGASVRKDGAQFGNRIYISRKRSKNRPLVCEGAIEDMVSARGFSVVYMEDYDFRTQVAIMANAEIVMAPHGAGLANLLFCAPGTRVVEMQANEYAPSTFYRMSKVCGFDYTPILGYGDMERSSNSDQLYWDIDLKKVESVLDRLDIR